MGGNVPRSSPVRKLSDKPELVYARLRNKRISDRGLCQCGGTRFEGRAQCQRCHTTMTNYRENLRREILAAYGNKCQCPGGCDIAEMKFLCLDHINNDGRAHRAEVGTDVAAVYRSVRRLGFPKDRFRVLCHNCNMAREFYGNCPHEKAT